MKWRDKGNPSPWPNSKILEHISKVQMEIIQGN
jgi:hypothetical protein